MTAPALDTWGMWEATAGLPEQVGEAAELAAAWPAPGCADLTSVVVLGSGTAAIAGEVLAMVAAPAAPVPVQVVAGYELPAHVGPGCLVLAMSASGETDETLVTAADALRSGARLVAVTAGGRLGSLAAGADAVVPLPAGLPAERVALGAMVAAGATLLERAGLVVGVADQLQASVRELQVRRDQLLATDSPAAALARRVGPTILLVHGTAGPAELAAHRWKAAVNANAKTPAFWAAEPDALYDEIAGWGVHGDVTRQVLTLVRLRHAGEHPRLARRVGLVEDLLLEVVSDVVELAAQGSSDLGRFLDLALVGDVVSLHLAAAAGVDPGPAPVLGDVAGER